MVTAITGYRNLTLNADLAGGIGLVQMLDNTNYIALVGGGRMPKFAATKASIIHFFRCAWNHILMQLYRSSSGML